MDLVVGFDDVKEAIARAIESQKRIHFLLEGPAACAKSIMLEGVRASVPNAYIVFGSRTSAAGHQARNDDNCRLQLIEEISP